MSEHQYYEFRALDRALSKDAMAELRSISSRATITPTSFVNVYNYGDFRGDPRKLMERHFDAFVYIANWGTRRLMLRVPRRALDPEVARAYCPGDEFGGGGTLHQTGEHVIIEWLSQAEEPEWVEGEEEWMASLLPLRADLASGDLRALYLGWLLSVQGEPYYDDDALEEDDEEFEADEEYALEDDEESVAARLDDGAIEPPVPPGLGELTGPLQAFAEFLRLDPDLLAVAAEGSAPARALEFERQALARWIAALPTAEKDALLLRAVEGGAAGLGAELLSRHRAAAAPSAAPRRGARTVAALLAAAEQRTAARKAEEARQRAAERAQHEAEEALARAAYLEQLGPRQEQLWTEVERLVDSKLPKSYDRAVGLLRDLHDLAVRDRTLDQFTPRLQALRERHLRKPTFVQRLDSVAW